MFETLPIPGLRLYTPNRHGDARGYFRETWNERIFAAEGLPAFVQDNEALSGRTGTVRGLHFQKDPHAQAKLLRCIAGAVLDVVVDIRHGSPAFGKHVAVELTPQTGAILVPVGCAHGYCTLKPDTLVQYKVSTFYAPQCEGGLAWNDPTLGINWPVSASAAIMSDRDRHWPNLADLPPVFTYQASN